jgi:hypothetical protein
VSRLPLILAPLAFACFAVPSSAQEVPDNPLIDYDGFVELTLALGETREAHRLPWETFIQQASADDAILLDTRSAAAFSAGHLEGAINLPFSDFTDTKLAAVLGTDRSRPIFIYCNNNFADDVEPVPVKRISLALNIPTFINLHGYGYTNVWELADVVTLGDPKVPWVTGKVALY